MEKIWIVCAKYITLNVDEEEHFHVMLHSAHKTLDGALNVLLKSNIRLTDEEINDLRVAAEADKCVIVDVDTDDKILDGETVIDYSIYIDQMDIED